MGEELIRGTREELDTYANGRAETDKRVSELEGAMQYLDGKVGEMTEIVFLLEKQLDPILSVERELTLAGADPAAVAPVDARSAHVKAITEQGARIEDVRNRVSRLIDRLDI